MKKRLTLELLEIILQSILDLFRPFIGPKSDQSLFFLSKRTIMKDTIQDTEN